MHLSISEHFFKVPLIDQVGCELKCLELRKLNPQGFKQARAAHGSQESLALLHVLL